MEDEQNDNFKNGKKLSFWDFRDETDDDEIIEPAFPKTLIPKKQMNYMHERLYDRIIKYQNSSCFGYMKAYYIFYRKAFDSKTDEDLQINSNNSLRSLKLFTYCLEVEEEQKYKNV